MSAHSATATATTPSDAGVAIARIAAALDGLGQTELLQVLPQLGGLLEHARARLVVVAASRTTEPEIPALLLKANDAAERMGIPRPWLMRAARQGRVRSHAAGRYRLFDPVELADDMKRLPVRSHAPIQRVCPVPSSDDSAGSSGSRKPRSARSSA